MTYRASRLAVERARVVECPTCGTPPGKRCRPGPSTHAARLSAAVAAYSAAEPVDHNAGPAVHMAPLPELDPADVLATVERLPDIADPFDAWHAATPDDVSDLT